MTQRDWIGQTDAVILSPSAKKVPAKLLFHGARCRIRPSNEPVTNSPHQLDPAKRTIGEHGSR